MRFDGGHEKQVEPAVAVVHWEFRSDRHIGKDGVAQILHLAVEGIKMAGVLKETGERGEAGLGKVGNERAAQLPDFAAKLLQRESWPVPLDDGEFPQMPRAFAFVAESFAQLPDGAGTGGQEALHEELGRGLEPKRRAAKVRSYGKGVDPEVDGAEGGKQGCLHFQDAARLEEASQNSQCLGALLQEIQGG